ncbi:uncharacterized protein [Garra rufa]|uniref:uncharacterized protein n=1 Tax=Garra rufa TaxID=137080 RepID=UPI003CCEAB08
MVSCAISSTLVVVYSIMGIFGATCSALVVVWSTVGILALVVFSAVLVLFSPVCSALVGFSSTLALCILAPPWISAQPALPQSPVRLCSTSLLNSGLFLLKSARKPLLRRGAMSQSVAGVPMSSTRGHFTSVSCHSTLDSISHNPLPRNQTRVIMSVEVNVFMDQFLKINTYPDQIEVADNLTGNLTESFYEDIVLKEQQRNTDLLVDYRSSQSSGSSLSTSQTFSKEETKDKNANLPHSKWPTISSINMLLRLEKQTDEPKEKDIKKPEEEDKNVYVVSREFVDILADAMANTEDSDSTGSDLQEIIDSIPAEKNNKLTNKLKELENVTLNIAITGMTGAGKSSLVNALRGLPYNDKNAAPTGVVETTMTPNMYQHPFMPNVKIWDLPGNGSPKFRAKKYLKNVNFHMYDFFLIVTSERFRENDIELARAIKKSKKLFYFVRTKIDNDIRAESHKRNFDEQMLLETIREDCKANLLKVGVPKIFLVSSFQLEKYDFQKLISTLEDELPKNKKFALIQSMPVYSLKPLTKKKTFSKKRIWLKASK